MVYIHAQSDSSSPPPPPPTPPLPLLKNECLSNSAASDQKKARSAPAFSAEFLGWNGLRLTCTLSMHMN